MPFSLTWLPDVLLAAGLKVATVDGWESRGSGDVGAIRGVICHHTAGRRTGNMPSLKTLIHGRPDLSGPLAQLGLGRDGTYYVIAAGRANHAGRGEWNQIRSGNSHFIGIEAENTGGDDDFPWPAVQVDAYQRGVSAMLQHLNLDASACCGHREYALPSGRKPDPTLDMVAMRAAIAAHLAGLVPKPPLIPATEPDVAPGGVSRPTLRRGARGDAVLSLQRQLHVETDGVLGPRTEAAVRAFQRAHGLVPDGIVGPKTWAALDRVPPRRSGIFGLSRSRRIGE